MLKEGRSRIIIILSVVAGILLGIKLILPEEKKLELIESSPSNNQEGVKIFSTLKFAFNLTTSSEELIILTNPDFGYSSDNFDKNTIEIKPENPLEFETEYSIVIKNNKYKDFYEVVKFKTENGEIPAYTQEQQKEFYEQLERQTYKDYPLFDFIPYQTDNFTVGYSRPLILSITLKKDTAEIRQEVLTWIRSKGVDPATHKIEWKYQP